MKSNIRKLRTERNLSQSALGEILGKTQQTISHMENDRSRIPADCLISMADFFGVSTDYILGLKEEESEPSEDIEEKVSNETIDIKNETEKQKMITGNVDSKMIYQLILSLLLCSLEEQVDSTQ